MDKPENLYFLNKRTRINVLYIKRTSKKVIKILITNFSE